MTCDKCGLTFSNPQVKIVYETHNRYFKYYLKNETGRRRTARWRIEQIKKMNQGGRLFEIGCSGGLFLDEARNAGFSVSGSELNKEAAFYARTMLGLTVYEEIDLFKIERDEKWDVIVMFNVLEHLSNPAESIRYILDNMLSREGLFVIEVPNIFTIHSRIAGTAGQHLSMVHNFYFSENTLENLFRRSGLEIRAKKWGKRIYSIGTSVGIVLRRHKWLKKLASGILKLMGMYNKEIPIGTHDFLFYMVSRKKT